MARTVFAVRGGTVLTYSEGLTLLQYIVLEMQHIKHYTELSCKWLSQSLNAPEYPPDKLP